MVLPLASEGIPNPTQDAIASCLASFGTFLNQFCNVIPGSFIHGAVECDQGLVNTGKNIIAKSGPIWSFFIITNLIAMVTLEMTSLITNVIATAGSKETRIIRIKLNVHCDEVVEDNDENGTGCCGWGP